MPTIGEQLKQARETRKLTIKQAVQATHLRAYYLQAMENDDFATMPSIAQARGFLRLYAEYLELDSEELITRFRSETNPEGSSPVPPVQSTIELPALTSATPPDPTGAISSPESNIEEAHFLSPAPSLPSQAIFIEIGNMLHERRELISLTLEEIERHTHVRKHNLQLIESGEFDQLPSPVQARGILSAYASFLDLDTDIVLLRYADALQTRRLERQPDPDSRSSRPRPSLGPPLWLRRFISPDLIFGGGMVLILLTLSIWGAARILSSGAATNATPTQGPSISDVLLATPAPGQSESKAPPTGIADEFGTALPTIDQALITPTETGIATVPSAVQITVVVLERAFLRITVDGVIKQDGRVAVGAALTFDGNDRIEVLTGSGSAVQIIYNQADLGMMGSFGEVVNRIYTVKGIETPTPTTSPTPTITPKPSPTIRPTLTLRPSPTLRPTSSPRPTVTATP
jgi:cytoskeletal protein RodZ